MDPSLKALICWLTFEQLSEQLTARSLHARKHLGNIPDLFNPSLLMLLYGYLHSAKTSNRGNAVA
jgi:hypothetical protein